MFVEHPDANIEVQKIASKLEFENVVDKGELVDGDSNSVLAAVLEQAKKGFRLVAFTPSESESEANIKWGKVSFEGVCELIFLKTGDFISDSTVILQWGINLSCGGKGKKTLKKDPDFNKLQEWGAKGYRYNFFICFCLLSSNQPFLYSIHSAISMRSSTSALTDVYNTFCMQFKRLYCLAAKKKRIRTGQFRTGNLTAHWQAC